MLFFRIFSFATIAFLIVCFIFFLIFHRNICVFSAATKTKICLLLFSLRNYKILNLVFNENWLYFGYLWQWFKDWLFFWGYYHLMLIYAAKINLYFLVFLTIIWYWALHLLPMIFAKFWSLDLFFFTSFQISFFFWF